MDFTITTYILLLKTLQTREYSFQTFESFITAPLEKVIILRHDVDRLPSNALKMARLEHKLGVAASYYFRAVPASWNEGIIRKVSSLGHEVGYHYEDLSLAQGDPEKAIRHFEDQLERFRRICPVKTICMHGSPLSRYDNRDLWTRYDYRDFGIIGEPYFDVDFKKVFYITDTGRKWNNEAASVRDWVESGFDIRIKNTAHLIELIEKGELPEKVMINVHPQRWTDKWWPWAKELVGQNVKNAGKKVLIRIRSGYVVK